MQTLVGGRTVASSAQDVTPLPYATGGNKHNRAGSIARALQATDQFKQHPVSSICNNILEHRGGAFEIVHHDVDPPSVKQVAERRSARTSEDGQPASRRRWYLCEPLAVQVSK